MEEVDAILTNGRITAAQVGEFVVLPSGKVISEAAADARGLKENDGGDLTPECLAKVAEMTTPVVKSGDGDKSYNPHEPGKTARLIYRKGKLVGKAVWI